MSYIYLASPYSDPSKTIQHARYLWACEAAAFMVRKGMKVYSPIVSWHKVAERFSLPSDAEFWSKQNASFMLHSTEMWVLTLSGWGQSKGVQSEIAFCKEQGIKIYYTEFSDMQKLIDIRQPILFGV